MDRLRSTELPPALVAAIEQRFIERRQDHGPLHRLEQWCYHRNANTCGDALGEIRSWLWWLCR